MVTKTFCDLCGKEIVEEGNEEKSEFIGTIVVNEFSSLDNFKAERVWYNHTLHLCPKDLKKIEAVLHLE